MNKCCNNLAPCHLHMSQHFLEPYTFNEPFNQLIKDQVCRGSVDVHICVQNDVHNSEFRLEFKQINYFIHYFTLGLMCLGSPILEKGVVYCIPHLFICNPNA